MLKGALKTRWGKIGLVLATTPIWKLMYHGLDALGNIETVRVYLSTIWRFFGTWYGAITLMVVGFVLLYRAASKPHTAQPKNDEELNAEIQDGDIKPETLISLFRSNSKLVAPYLDQPMTTAGIVYEQYYATLKVDTNAVLLKRGRNTNVIAHFNRDSDGYHQAFGMYRCEVRLSGRVVTVDSDVVTLEDCELLEVKPRELSSEA